MEESIPKKYELANASIEKLETLKIQSDLKIVSKTLHKNEIPFIAVQLTQ